MPGFGSLFQLLNDNVPGDLGRWAYYPPQGAGVASNRLGSPGWLCFVRIQGFRRTITKKGTNMTKLITVLLSLVASSALYAQSPTAVRDQVFGETDAVKKQAEELHAQILAPAAYAEGTKVYLEAVDTMEKGKDLGRVREELAEAKGHFQHAVDVFVLLYGHVEGAKQTFGREVVHDEPMRQPNRLIRDRAHLRV